MDMRSCCVFASGYVRNTRCQHIKICLFGILGCHTEIVDCMLDFGKIRIVISGFDMEWREIDDIFWTCSVFWLEIFSNCEHKSMDMQSIADSHVYSFAYFFGPEKENNITLESRLTSVALGDARAAQPTWIPRVRSCARTP